MNWNDSFWQNDHLGTNGWLLYDVAGTTTNFSNLSLAVINWLDSNGAQFDTVLAGETSDAMFFLSLEGQDIYLNFQASVSPPPVPEPGSLSLLLVALGLMTMKRGLRKRD